MKWLLILSFFGAAAATGATWSDEVFRRVKSQSEGVTSCTLAPAAASAQETAEGNGYAEPVSEVRKLRLRTGGVLRSYHVAVGDRVRKGDLIVELDDSTQRADIEVARKQMELVRAEAASSNAGINPYRIEVVEKTVERLREKCRHQTAEYERYRALLSTRAASSQDFEAMETLRRQADLELREQEAELVYLRKYVTAENRAMMEAKVRVAEANLQLAEERLREMKLLAPFDGTVLKLLKQEGEGISQFLQEPVVAFGDLTQMRVRAEIDERVARKVAEGQEAVVFGRNLDGKSYKGRVVRVERIMGDKTAFTGSSSERKNLEVLQAVIELGPDFQAPAGLQVEVRIDVAASSGLGSAVSP